MNAIYIEQQREIDAGGSHDEELKKDDKMTNKNDIGNILKRRRLMAGLTLNQVSAASGVSTSYLARIECGERYPSASILRKIAGPLGIGEIELFTYAGLLSSESSARIEKPTGERLDPYVASVLSREPLEIQQSVLAIITMLKYMSKGFT